jgi:hypothetical protein
MSFAPVTDAVNGAQTFRNIIPVKIAELTALEYPIIKSEFVYVLD